MATQGYNQPAEIPRELDRWNWGAFFLNWIWGLGNSTYIALLMFVPFVNLVMIFILGARGSAWAWKNGRWRDVEHFKRVQRAWAIWGLASWVVVIGLGVWGVLGLFSLLKSSEPYQMALTAIRSDAEVQAVLGDNISDGFFITGSINLSGGRGEADFVIPLQGSKGSGSATTHSILSGGQWDMRLLIVTPANGQPIVLVNKDNVRASGSVGA